MVASRIQVILVVFLVVLAGCGESITPNGENSSPDSTQVLTPSQSPSSTSASGPNEVEVKNGELPVDATEVWHRTLELRGQSPSTSYAPTVYVEPLPNQTQRIPAVSFGFHPPSPPDRLMEFGELMGTGRMGPNTPPPDAVGGQAGGTTVTLQIGDEAPASRIEATLAHEFEHLLQPDGWTTAEVPEWAIKEGGALYIQRAYADRYLTDIDPAEEVNGLYLNSSDGGEQFFYGLYYFGYSHFETRIDSPADITEVYETPPRTYEQLIHGYTPNEEPPKRLDVQAGNSLQSAPVGELFLRVSLATELDETGAARASTGWGNDSVVPIDENDNYVWVVRMDDEQNASELEDAFREYLDAKGTAAGDSWRTDRATYRLVRISDETLALAVGSDEFVQDVSVTGSNETVTISS